MATGTVKTAFWSQIVGQTSVREHLARSLRANHAAHAYLITGPAGVGKAAVALEFASLLLCDQSELFPCGTCPQCLATARLQHPDLHLVFPLPPVKTRKRADDGDGDSPEEDPTGVLGDRIALLTSALAANPYTPIVLPKTRAAKEDQKAKIETLTIKIPQIRSLLHAAAMKPYQARRKVFVILQADAMNDSAQNALLKALEEPGEEAFFLLTTDNESLLRATIRSRCQRVQVSPLPQEEIVAALVSDGIPPERAAASAALSGGSIAHARDLAGAELETMQHNVIEFLRAAAVGDPVKLVAAAPPLLDSGKLPESTSFELISAFLRDVAFRRAHGGPTTVPTVFAAFEKPISDFIAAYPDADFPEAVKAADESADYLSRGYSADFVLYSLAIRIHDALGTRVFAKPKPAVHNHA